MPGIDYTLGMKTGGFSTGVQGALGKLSDLGKKVATITAAAGLAAGIGLGAVVAKGIQKAAEIETLETAFAPLLGGFEKAQQRIEELTKFANATPLELPEIAQASKVLETLTRGALSTGSGLEFVGDVASGTGQNFAEVAVTIGRLYDGLDSGRPVGEAIARLQELGAVSGDTRGQIEQLQKEGKKGAEVWDIAAKALGKFSGSMVLQSRTWNGLMSTLSGTISNTLAKFGDPIMDSLKPYLMGLTGQVERLEAFAVRMGQNVAGALDLALSAWETSTLPEIIGDGLTLAFIDGINMLSGGIRKVVAYLGAAVPSLWDGLINSSALQTLGGILMSLGEAVGAAITGAILKGMDGVLGYDATDGIAQADDDRRHGLNQAKYLTENFDGGEAVANMMETIKKADDAGKAAAAQAGNDPLLNRDGAAKRYADSTKAANEQTARRKAKQEADLKKLEETLKKGVSGNSSGGATDTADKAAKSTGSNRPSADRLTQIGFHMGGASQALAQRAAEKTASGMALAVKHLASIDRRAGQPTTAGGVF